MNSKSIPIEEIKQFLVRKASSDSDLLALFDVVKKSKKADNNIKNNWLSREYFRCCIEPDFLNFIIQNKSLSTPEHINYKEQAIELFISSLPTIISLNRQIPNVEEYFLAFHVDRAEIKFRIFFEQYLEMLERSSCKKQVETFCQHFYDFKTFDGTSLFSDLNRFLTGVAENHIFYGLSEDCDIEGLEYHLIYLADESILSYAAERLVLDMTAKAIVWIEAIISNIEQHKKILSIKKRQLITQDDYGAQDSSAWEKEFDYFFEKIVYPSVHSAINSENVQTILKIPSKPSLERLEKARKEIEETIELLLDLNDISEHPTITKLEFNILARSTYNKICDLDEVEDLEEPAEDYLYNEGMSGLEYEAFLVSLFEDTLIEATATSGSGDFGIDVILEYDEIRIGIQCKHYNSPVGISAVQEAYSGKVFYECDEAMVISNTTFTKAAKKLASKSSIILAHHEQLIDLAIAIFDIDEDEDEDEDW